MRRGQQEQRCHRAKLQLATAAPAYAPASPALHPPSLLPSLHQTHLPFRSGAFHPELEDELQAALKAAPVPEGQPSGEAQAPGSVCGCSWPWLDPCRVEFQQVGV